MNQFVTKDSILTKAETKDGTGIKKIAFYADGLHDSKDAISVHNFLKNLEKQNLINSRFEFRDLNKTKRSIPNCLHESLPYC